MHPGSLLSSAFSCPRFHFVATVSLPFQSCHRVRDWLSDERSPFTNQLLQRIDSLIRSEDKTKILSALEIMRTLKFHGRQPVAARFPFFTCLLGVNYSHLFCQRHKYNCSGGYDPAALLSS